MKGKTIKLEMGLCYLSLGLANLGIMIILGFYSVVPNDASESFLRFFEVINGMGFSGYWMSINFIFSMAIAISLVFELFNKFLPLFFAVLLVVLDLFPIFQYLFSDTASNKYPWTIIIILIHMFLLVWMIRANRK